MSAASSREAWLRLEYEAVAKAAVSDRSISGVYVVPSPEAWHGMISVRQAFFKSALFRFAIHLPAGYPEVPPVIKFSPSAIECAGVSREGGLSLGPEFEPWDKAALCRHGVPPLLAVLRFIKRIFYDQPCDTADAADRARHSADKSRQALHVSEEQNSRLRFDVFDWRVHGHALKQMGCASLPAARLIQRSVQHWVRRQRAAAQLSAAAASQT
eukprot:CAMPEP_0181198222 /NCGR_PEP_ID=MMETSP1096-20121128/16493_1 /TAXON_ID=156174 ORGANISM="Chrysochromulina ericina, Strain CCMP281" /NCGR_SAMPLE_ID=MMETSP1096 /ASSEMBLY_ACC=CAM_ASM_000453 /LENGTH=212 /DNA_ID=CAMNT_0023288253 /DNA_START=108 /DNA_END=746 /DNA_ORIENTATION=+